MSSTTQAQAAPRRGVRSQLSASIASAAGPYGYTISLGGSTALAAGQLGKVKLLEALLVMLGAVAAFVSLEVAAQGSLVPTPAEQDAPPSIWGNAHVPSAGGALAAVWGLLQVLQTTVAWLLVGYVATSVYFVVTALQRITIDAARHRMRSRHRGAPARR